MTTATMSRPNPTLKSYFTALTPGKLMGLRQITDDKGRFKVFALDQSNSFKKALRALADKLGKPAEPTYAQIRDCKIEMVKVLSPLSSAVLLDVNFGARQALNSFAFPKTVGLIVRSEASKDAGIPSEYEPGWSVEKIKKMGAAAVKLLVYLDVEDKDNTKAQLAFVEKLSKACREQDILLMTEELSFPRKGEDKKTPSYKARKVDNIIEATKLIGPLTDILKLEYPANMGDDSEAQQVENLGRMNEAAIRPWVLLSAGEKFDVFAKQVELAMKAGCSGYMAGRAIFNEYFEQNTPEARHNFLQSTAMDRMKLLNKSVESYSPSWMARYGIAESEMAAAVTPTWYLGKGETAGKGGATEGAY
jgi:tagatose 1,6-diphosphate aldolase